MGGENGNFRSRLFGGFDRSDVIKYIEKLAEERNSLRMENERLQEQAAQLEEQLSGKNAEGDSRILQLEAQLEEERTKSCEAWEATLADVENAVRELRQKYEEIRSDMDINLTQTRCEITKAGECVDRMYAAFESAGTRLDEIEKTVLSMKKSAGNEGEIK